MGLTALYGMLSISVPSDTIATSKSGGGIIRDFLRSEVFVLRPLGNIA